jgi:glycosyltransferase involved in cell wall biosynthesis
MAYKTAHFITGESKEYAGIAHHNNPNVPYTYTYLGVDMPKINELIKGRKKELPKDNTIKICYGGNLGNSYDFDAIIKALANLSMSGINYSMYFIGGGDKEEIVNNRVTETGVNAIVTGIVSYQEYIGLMSQCDIGLNVFKRGTKIVHSYKFNDYAACGLFIVNNLHGETEEMIAEYDCGVTSDDVCKALLDVCLSWETNESKKQNSLRMANVELNAEVIYKNQTAKILKLLND